MPDQPRLIDDPGDGTEVHLDLGAVVVLALRAPGATGHRWHPVGRPMHATVEPSDVLPAELDDPAARLPGRTGRAIFLVTGSTPGTDVLTFALQRAWEDAPVRTLTVSVVVD